ncbi:hypothetical protein [Natronincola ferrireducens]|uniref:Uncharacterized protein n=1 Tax=Natronincola ferrireducens TaxID=393762 RepID=A0A1G9II07_9FIRM|nr:hypothetical protein [Natronincola ferrireducens]SDL24859.1 hypothetical protein SAMN05660472_02879 [Natronincola ferrireducens]
MFKINKLIMYGVDDREYIYKFASGVNYFKGKNSSGKTEFYSFIDFMFGSAEDISKKPWYNDTLEKASIIFQVDGIKYVISRTRNTEENYLHYADEEEGESINLREYKGKLNSIFTKDESVLKNIRNFTDEELTYRAFTMFNFLGEQRQGVIHDFLDKCSDIKYSVKLAPILNFIFNKNLDKIYELQQELDLLLEEIKGLEESLTRHDFICTLVNNNLQKLGSNAWYTGKNASDVKKQLNDIKDLQSVVKKKDEKNIADLEVMYNNISEQIKIYENKISDTKQFKKDNSNRKMLLERLNSLLEENQAFEYLIKPLEKLVSELDNTISFSKYIISDNTINELRKQRDDLKTEIKRNDARFKCYSIDEKTKAIALIEDYLSVNISFNDNELKEKRKRIKEIRKELRVLQNSDDSSKREKLSQYITKLYQSAQGISSVVDDDINQEGFKIKYFKKGNILQPVIIEKTDDEKDSEKKKEVNYYIGSMARHTLIQLCGYFGFLDMLIGDNKYPLIPILVIDHISKPFDESNKKAIGTVIKAAYESIGKDRLQIFMFDDEDYESLDLKPEHSNNLVTDKKTGFNPFYIPLPKQQNEDETIKDKTKD